ncbi:NTP transferase domain-containing protein [Conexibacter sp. SYSU D00693]|uniref:phosphocholine cytidylyltransferase family protein n=1 Tax=Conexibacter sp. SYSU D00693 TaxID=2812560 RepID=UPI00196B091E|nr:NTP transferase domain-containing protein [Conexibacter sp. SYSU D00693]
MNFAPSPRPVHVVVLAAGRGSRLGALGDATPKWLLEVGGRTLADRHLEAFAAAGGAVASVRVVTGHAATAIIHELADSPQVDEVVHNPQYATRNNWWSLLLALRRLPAGEPVAVVNADLLADPDAVASFLVAAANGPAEGLLAVDLQRLLTDESMKVQLDDGGALSRIGKVGIAAPVGEYVGLLMARGRVLTALRAALERFADCPASFDEWYEGAVGATAATGHRWEVWPMPSSGWVEIDDDADLDLARTVAAGAPA